MSYFFMWLHIRSIRVTRPPASLFSYLFCEVLKMQDDRLKNCAAVNLQVNMFIWYRKHIYGFYSKTCKLSIKGTDCKLNVQTESEQRFLQSYGFIHSNKPEPTNVYILSLVILQRLLLKATHK